MKTAHVPYSISPSQLDVFGCRLAWYWSHPLGYQPIKKAAALELGEGVHYALEMYYSEGRHPAKVFARWADKLISRTPAKFASDIEQLMSNKALGMAMLDGYYDEYHGKEPLKVISVPNLDPKLKDKLAAEHTMTRVLPDPNGKPTNCIVTVRLDTIVEHTKFKKLFVLEHKTFSRFSPSQLFRNHQFIAQAWVAQEVAGRPIAGVIYNGLRKQIPSSRVRLALYERHPVYVNDFQIATFLKRAYWEYRKMIQPNLPIYPEPNDVRCGTCSYGQPCAEYMRGGDYEFLLKTMFTKRPRPEATKS